MADWQDEALALGFRLVLGVTFLRAGLSKLVSREHFALAVTHYGIVGQRVSRHVARWLPPTEVVLGCLLLVGVLQTAVSLTLAALLVVFGGGVVVNLVRGRVIDCGCFGPGAQKRITWWTVLRNVGLAVAALAVAANPSTMLTPGHIATTLSAGEAVAVLVAAVSVLVTERLAAESLAARRAVGRLPVLEPRVAPGP